MKMSTDLVIAMLIVFCFAGLNGRAVAQGIRNEGATINITGGNVVCQGGLTNSSGTVTNNGTLTLSGGLTNTSTMQGNGTWSLGGNWINNGTFTPGSGTVTFNGAIQTINGTITPELVPTVFNNLYISSSVSTTISAGYAVTVNSALTTNDKLAIGSSSLTSSGSLIVNGTSSGTVTYNRIMPGSAWHYVSSPVSLTSKPLGDFYTWNEVAGDWDANPITTAPEIGRGYTLQTTGNSVSFTGTIALSPSVAATSPYTTDYGTGYPTAPGSLADYNARWASGRTAYGGGGWNLLGNPFTSAMTIADFLEANDGVGSYSTNLFDPNYVAVYIYDGNGYWFKGKPTGFVDPVQGETPANQVFDFENIQAGQGFFVLAMKHGVVFNFDRSMQEHGPATTMMKSAGTEDDSWPGLRLKVKYGEKESSALVIYNDDLNAGLDPGYDVGMLSAGADVDVYTSLVAGDNSVNFAQQALPVSDAEKLIVPVGVDSEKGGEITFSAYSVPLGDNRFWLEDRQKGIFTDLSLKSYTVALPAATYGTGRFFILASANMPTGNEELTPEDNAGLRIWGYDRKAIIRGEVAEGAVCEIFDTGGRKLLVKRLAEGELNTVDLPEGIHGVIVIRVTDKGRVTTRRLALL